MMGWRGRICHNYALTLQSDRHENKSFPYQNTSNPNTTPLGKDALLPSLLTPCLLMRISIRAIRIYSHITTKCSQSRLRSRAVTRQPGDPRRIRLEHRGDGTVTSIVHGHGK